MFDIIGARKNFYSIVDKALNYEPVTITTKSGNVVMISETDLDRIKETFYLMNDPDFLNDVKKYCNMPDSEFRVWN